MVDDSSSARVVRAVKPRSLAAVPALPRRNLIALVVGLLGLMSVVPSSASPSQLRIGALFPLQGPLGAAAGEERLGVQIAADLVNQDGGVQGRKLALEDRELSLARDANRVVGELRDQGVPVIIGTYSSSLSLPASAAAGAAGMVYWEAGATADQVTGRGLPLVFRVGATGSNLGSNSARFTATELAPRLGRPPASTRVVLVNEDDDYGRSVAAGVVTEAHAQGLVLAGQVTYNAYAPDFSRVLGQVAALRADVLILASYIGDGVAFRRAMLAAGLHVGALIGSTMAECGPEFGGILGADSVGVFASDRPGQGFSPAALRPEGRAAYDRFAATWRERTGRDPGEEGLAGFAAAWSLFHYVLPGATSLDAAGIAAAARSTHLAEASLPNGAGLDFSTDPATLGQNLAASAVIWQWQAVGRNVVVWPPTYATGRTQMVPLPR
jgi:branched-chain amino acid transport system substrate-binding protein